jgi:cytochrome c556
MAHIDRSNDRLKLSAAENWQAPKDHPDLSPPQEALLLKEGLVEARRHLAEDYDQSFRDQLEQAAAVAAQLEAALRQADRQAATEHFQSLARSCKQCHSDYRN